MGASGLGNLLVKEGFLTEQDRQTIVKTCGQGSWAFAKSILTMGLLDEDELAAFLAERTRYVVAPRDLLDRIDPNITKKIDKRLLSKLEILPIEMDHYRITVAVADPLDKATLRQLEFFTGLEVVPIIAPISQIYEGLMRLNPDFRPSLTALTHFLRNHSGSAWVKQKIVENPDAQHIAPLPPPDRHGAHTPKAPVRTEEEFELEDLPEPTHKHHQLNLDDLEAPSFDSGFRDSDFSDIPIDAGADADLLGEISDTPTATSGGVGFGFDFDEPASAPSTGQSSGADLGLWGDEETSDTPPKDDEGRDELGLWGDEEPATSSPAAKPNQTAADESDDALDVLGSMDSTEESSFSAEEADTDIELEEPNEAEASSSSDFDDEAPALEESVDFTHEPMATEETVDFDSDSTATEETADLDGESSAFEEIADLDGETPQEDSNELEAELSASFPDLESEISLEDEASLSAETESIATQEESAQSSDEAVNEELDLEESFDLETEAQATPDSKDQEADEALNFNASETEDSADLKVSDSSEEFQDLLQTEGVMNEELTSTTEILDSILPEGELPLALEEDLEIDEITSHDREIKDKKTVDTPSEIFDFSFSDDFESNSDGSYQRKTVHQSDPLPMEALGLTADIDSSVPLAELLQDPGQAELSSLEPEPSAQGHVLDTLSDDLAISNSDHDSSILNLVEQHGLKDSFESALDVDLQLDEEQAPATLPLDLNPHEEVLERVDEDSDLQAPKNVGFSPSPSDSSHFGGSDSNLLSILSFNDSTPQNPHLSAQEQKIAEARASEPFVADDDIQLSRKQARSVDDDDVPALVSPNRKGAKALERRLPPPLPVGNMIDRTHQLMSQLSLCFDAGQAQTLLREHLPHLTKEGALITFTPDPQILLVWKDGQPGVQLSAPFLKFIRNLRPQIRQGTWSQIQIPRSAQWIGKSSELNLYALTEESQLYLWLSSPDSEAKEERELMVELIHQVLRKNWSP